MPIATPFKALAAGNGFPFCLHKIDVSSSEDYITLGGTRKGSPPTAAEKKLSLINAMNIYWNLHQISVSASATTFHGYDDGYYNGSSDANWSAAQPQPFNTQPKERVNNNNSYSAQERYGGLNNFIDLGTAGYANSSIGEVGSSGGTNVFPIAMYNGAVTNNNFVGYGLSEFVKIRGSYGSYSNLHLSGPNMMSTQYDMRVRGEVGYSSYVPFDPFDLEGYYYLGSSTPPQNKATTNIQVQSSPFPILKYAKCTSSLVALPRLDDDYTQNLDSPSSWNWAWGGGYEHSTSTPDLFSTSTSAGAASATGPSTNDTSFSLSLSSVSVSYFTYDS
jgi:hypothetical protein